MPFDTAYNPTRREVNALRRELWALAQRSPLPARWKQCRYLGRLMASASVTVAMIGARQGLSEGHAGELIRALVAETFNAAMPPAPSQRAKASPKAKPVTQAAPTPPAPPVDDGAIELHWREYSGRAGQVHEGRIEAGELALRYEYYRKALKVTESGAGYGYPKPVHGPDGSGRTNRFATVEAAKAAAAEDAPRRIADLRAKREEREARERERAEDEARRDAAAVFVTIDGTQYRIREEWGFPANHAFQAFSGMEREGRTVFNQSVARGGSVEECRAALDSYIEEKREWAVVEAKRAAIKEALAVAIAAPVEEPAIPAAFLGWLAEDSYAAGKARGNRDTRKFRQWGFAPARDAVGAYIECFNAYGNGWAPDTPVDDILALRAWVVWRAREESGKGKWLTKHDSGPFVSRAGRVNIAQVHGDYVPVMVEVKGKAPALLNAGAPSWLKDLGAALA